MLIKQKVLYLVAFSVLFLVVRIPGLQNDIINPDAVNWHYRSQQFIVALKSGAWQNTYQHYHPGVTLMWIAGPIIELSKIYTNNPIYNHLNFPIFDFNVKLGLVIVQLMLSIYGILLLSKVLDFKKSTLVFFFFSFEPFVIGNSRLFHMDLLFTLFVFIALVHFYLFYKNKMFSDLVLASVFAGLSFLTRSIGIGVILFGIIFTVILLVFDDRKLYINQKIKFIFYTLLFFSLTIFILFPALWVSPIKVFSGIFSEGERVGIRKGHPQVVLGEETTDAGLLFYPLVLLLKSSPFFIIFLTSYFITLKKSSSNFPDINRFLIFVGIFYVGYFLVMSIPTKKIDRYMITIYPFLSLLVLQAINFWYIRVKSTKAFFLFFVVFYFIFSLFGVIKFFPYLFTYTSINPAIANSLVAQKSFGVGIYEVKSKIYERFGETTLGFYDVKPIEAIYPNSKVFDVREIGPGSYDVLVLTLHEALPEKLQKSTYDFQHVDSVFINGLEYWKIYEKQ